MEINFNDLKKKEVVDISNGKNLGKISDLIIDVESGEILKIIVPGRKGFLNCDEIIIDFNCIVKIGDDTILYKKCRPKQDCPPPKCEPDCPPPKCEEDCFKPPRRDFDDE